jgi:hypothetical protein
LDGFTKTLGHAGWARKIWMVKIRHKNVRAIFIATA